MSTLRKTENEETSVNQFDRHEITEIEYLVGDFREPFIDAVVVREQMPRGQFIGWVRVQK